MRELEISAEISTMRTLTEAFTINNKTILNKRPRGLNADAFFLSLQ